jgi:RsmE family RNA methyltransferase
MNILLLSPDDLIGSSRARVSGRRLQHARDVLKLSVGDELFVGLLGGRMGTGTIVSINDASMEIEVWLDREPPAPLPVTVLLALPRPKVMRRVLFTLTVLGVKRIILFNAARVEKSYWQTPFLLADSVRRQLILGLEQARDIVLPEVLFRSLFRPFVEDEVPGLVHGTVPLVAHPHADAPCPRAIDRPVTLAIGPEGGFVPFEIARFLDAGFTSVNVGQRTLNVETAIPSLVSRLFLI